MNWLDLLAVRGTVKSFVHHHSSKASILRHSAFLYSSTFTSIHDYWKKHSFAIHTFVDKVMALLFNILPRFVIAFLPRRKCFLISRLQSPSAVIQEPNKRKSVTISTIFPSICHDVMGLDAMVLVFLMLSYKPALSLSSFTLIKGSLVLLHFMPLEWYHLHI